MGKYNEKFFTFDGKTQSLKNWAKEYNISYNTLYSRVIRYNIPFEKALHKKVVNNFIKDISGKKNNLLTAIKFIRKSKTSHYIWLFKCDCGKEKEIRLDYVENNRTKSCGCLRKTRNGLCTMKNRLYRIYRAMITRCYNPNHERYDSYGGRGITICEEWLNDFQKFYDWALNHDYEKTLTIDRIDNNGNYESNNCRWITYKEQSYNRSNSIYITAFGETKLIHHWMQDERCCVSYALLRKRIFYGNWSAEEALTVPRVKKTSLEGYKKEYDKKYRENNKERIKVYQKERKKRNPNIQLKKLLTFNNKTQSISDWAKELNIMSQTIYVRLKRGLTVDEALSRKVDNHMFDTKYEYTLNGKTQSVRAWAKEIGIPYNTVYGRIRKGWPIEQALTTAVKAK